MVRGEEMRDKFQCLMGDLFEKFLKNEPENPTKRQIKEREEAVSAAEEFLRVAESGKVSAKDVLSYALIVAFNDEHISGLTPKGYAEIARIGGLIKSAKENY